MSKARVTKVVNPSKRAGTSDKGVAWNIMTVEVEKDDGALVQADSFDTLADGDIVELEPNNYTNPTTGKTYNGWNAKVPKQYPGQKPSQSESNAELLQAIRMVFREVKEVRVQVDKLLGVDAGLKADNDPEPSGKAMPADFGLTDDDPRHPKNQPDVGRDWQSVGKATAPEAPEPTVEPLPGEPEDLEDFMNG